MAALMATSWARTVGLYPERPNANSSWASNASNQSSITGFMYLPEGMPINRHTRINCFFAFAEYFVGLCFRRSMRTTFLTPMVCEVRYRLAVDRPNPVEAQN
ncbi:hypothetical protein [Auritidibacter sp. NML130574]|uniref:hypothetical protein n=1 Tax=Auritidibacter sp. NML130574 TaxID=2170745 RepID=UPI001FF055A8|nr:hypothetical protein [Auritidibacter sp. NML130574]